VRAASSVEFAALVLDALVEHLHVRGVEGAPSTRQEIKTEVD
jgi:hypothetical protein